MSTRKKTTTVVIIGLAVLILLAGIFVPLFYTGTLGSQNVFVPILMYHQFSDEEPSGTNITAGAFESQLKALADAGYTTISFQELCDYVYEGAPLPKKPLVITIDDGYMHVYDTAYPLLKKYDMKATVFIIGVTHGKEFYKDTTFKVIPHLGDAQVRELEESGVLSVQSHSYDMHQYEPYETGPARVGVLQLEGESEEEYIRYFNEDIRLASEQLEGITGAELLVFSYPYGKCSELSERLLKEAGVKVTLTIVEGVNNVIRNSPESLFSLKRYNVPGDMTPEELLEKITVGTAVAESASG